MAGRKAKPVDAILAEGNKSNLTKAEIEARREAEEKLKPATDKIRCPTWLDKTGKRTWRAIVKELIEIDLMTNVDVYSLALACDAYSKYIEATKAIDEEGLTIGYTNAGGNTNIVANPNIAIAQKYGQQFKSYLSEFGLSPAARARLALHQLQEDDEDDEDLLD